MNNKGLLADDNNVTLLRLFKSNEGLVKQKQYGPICQIKGFAQDSLGKLVVKRVLRGFENALCFFAAKGSASWLLQDGPPKHSGFVD